MLGFSAYALSGLLLLFLLFERGSLSSKEVTVNLYLFNSSCVLRSDIYNKGSESLIHKMDRANSLKTEHFLNF